MPNENPTVAIRVTFSSPVPLSDLRSTLSSTLGSLEFILQRDPERTDLEGFAWASSKEFEVAMDEPRSFIHLTFFPRKLVDAGAMELLVETNVFVKSPQWWWPEAAWHLKPLTWSIFKALPSLSATLGYDRPDRPAEICQDIILAVPPPVWDLAVKADLSKHLSICEVLRRLESGLGVLGFCRPCERPLEPNRKLYFSSLGTADGGFIDWSECNREFPDKTSFAFNLVSRQTFGGPYDGGPFPDHFQSCSFSRPPS
jgi:hypothetical protein